MPSKREWVVDEKGYHAKSVWESSPSSTSPVSNDVSDASNTPPQKASSPYAKIVLSKVELIPISNGFEFNKKCKAKATVDVKDKSIGKRVTFRLFCKYNETEYEIKPPVEGVIHDTTAEAEMTLYYGEKEDGCTYYEDSLKNPDLTCEYIVRASHPATSDIKEIKSITMPQTKKAWVPLLTYSSKYSKVNAYNLALFADLAYGKVEQVVDFFDKFKKGEDRDFKTANINASPFLQEAEEKGILSTNIDLFFSDEKTDTQFFIAVSEKQFLIVVRGTEPTQWKDWLQDAKAEQVDFSENEDHGQVHKGFYQGFTFVKDKINEFLSERDINNKELIITGHSLGGAIAILTAAWLSDNPQCKSSKIMLYTYGSPRVGNKTFYNYFSKKFVYYRCVNDKDLVTNIPLPGIDLKVNYIPFTKIPVGVCLFDLDFDLYTHLGTKVLVHILSSDQAVVHENYTKKVTTYAKFSSVPVTGISDLTLLEAWTSVKDHFMTEYFKYLKNDMISSIRLYPKDKTIDLSVLEQEITLLIKEIDDLKEEIQNLEAQARSHEDLATDPENSDIKSYHEKEAADLRYKSSSINVTMKDKEVDLSNFETTYDYYKKNGTSKKDVVSDLTGMADSTSVVEKEIMYHSENY